MIASASLLVGLLYGALVPPPCLIPTDKPEGAAYLEQLADAYASWGGTQGAAACYRKALELQPDRHTARLGLARQLAAQGHGREAVAEVDRVLAAEARHYGARRLRGLLALHGRAPADAEQMLRDCLAERPEDSLAQLWMAQAQLAQRKIDSAEVTLRDAVRADPTLAEAHFLLAQVLLGRQRAVAATAALRRHLRLFPDNPDALVLMAQLLMGQRRPAEALVYGRKLAHLRPRDARVWGGLATCYEQLHRPDDAAGAWRRVYSLATETPMVLGSAEWLARYHFGRQEFATTAGYLRRLISLKPALLPPRRQLVSCLVAVADWPGTAGAVRGLVLLQPRDVGLRLQWIEALLRAGDLRAAREAALRTMSEVRRPDLPATVIRLFVGTGQPGLAIGLLDELRRRQPERLEYVALLADVLVATGRGAEARRMLAGLAETMPGDAGLRVRLAGMAYAVNDWGDVADWLEPLFRPDGEVPVEVLVPLAFALERLGRAGKAAQIYSKLAEQTGETAVLLRVARLYSRVGDLPRARDVCEQVLAKEPEHVPTVVELAGLLAALGELDAAVRRYGEALTLEPRNALALGGLLRLRRQRGELALAAELARKLVELDPTADLAILELGQLAWDREQRDEAIRIWLDGVADCPGSAALHARLAAAYEEVRDEPAALRHYTEAARRASQDLASRFALSRLYGQAGDWSQARRWSRDLVDRWPDMPGLYHSWLGTFEADGQAGLLADAGVELLQTGSPRGALVGPLLDSALRLGQADRLAERLDGVVGAGEARPATLDAQGQLILREGRREAAIEHYQRLADTRSEPLWPRRLAEIHRAASDWQRTIEACARALTRSPGDQGVLALQAEAHQAAGDIPAALEAVRRMIRARPREFGPLFATIDRLHAGGHALAVKQAIEGLLPRTAPPPPELRDNAALLMALGRAAEQAGALAEAEGAYREALATDATLRAAGESVQRVREAQLAARGLTLPPTGAAAR